MKVEQNILSDKIFNILKKYLGERPFTCRELITKEIVNTLKELGYRKVKGYKVFYEKDMLRHLLDSLKAKLLIEKKVNSKTFFTLNNGDEVFVEVKGEN